MYHLFFPLQNTPDSSRDNCGNTERKIIDLASEQVLVHHPSRSVIKVRVLFCKMEDFFWRSWKKTVL